MCDISGTISHVVMVLNANVSVSVHIISCASTAVSSCLVFVLLDRISPVSAVHQASCCSAHLFLIISSASWPVTWCLPSCSSLANEPPKTQLFLQQSVRLFQFPVIAVLCLFALLFQETMSCLSAASKSLSLPFYLSSVESSDLQNHFVKSPLTIFIMLFLLFIIFCLVSLCFTLNVTYSNIRWIHSR